MITRRTMLTLPAALGSAAGAGHGSMMWDYFMRELDAADARRSAALREVRTAAQLTALGERVRRTLLAAIGGFPERTPLRPRVTGKLKRSGYVIEKIVFESRPNYFVTANLYLPERVASPRPAVIQSCGHYPEGKASPDYQRVCIGLAKRGIAALIFDPLGQGERLMYRDAAGKPLGGGGTSEHGIAGRPSFLVGRPLAHYRVWDAVRALDYLETRAEIDKSRLGMCGQSGGGMMTLLTAPLDTRLRAVMSNCAVTSFYHKTRGLLIADPEQIVPGIYLHGIDHPELIAAVAPRAFLTGAALEDFVPLDGTRRTYAEARAVFERAGMGDRCGIVETPGPHKFNRQMREACYGWMQKHLGAEAADTAEPETEVETAATLRCTPNGSVMELPGARDIFELNREHARGLAAGRRGEPDLRRLLSLPARVVRERGIELPSNATGTGESLIILVGPKREPELARGLAGAGRTVVELDLRGWGETTPVMPDKKAGFSWDDFFAFRAIEMGRPLPGMRVQDLLSEIGRHAGKKIYVVGVRGGGIVALHAAALDERIAGVAAVHTPRSYAEIMEQRTPREPVSSYVPGALAHYDLPQLAARIQPRPCVTSVEGLDASRILQGLRLG